jgi:peroxiredoxin
VLVFLSSWCDPCARWQAALGELVRRYRDVVAFVGIAGQDEPRALARFLDEHRASYPVGIDGSLEIWRRYAVREPPATVLISRGGRLLRGWPGMAETRPLEEALDRLVVSR